VTVDQSKVNMIYIALSNPATGKSTLYLAKRPGYTINGSTYGTATSQYLVTAAGAVAGGFWVIDRNAGDTATRASDSSGTTTIATDAYYPHFIDHTLISGVDTVVLQTFASATAMKVWYASARNSWTQITDGDFTALTPTGKMEHLDGFAFQMTSDNKIYNSDLNSLANWTATNYLQKQIQQDSASGLAKFKNQILAFGAQSMEVFYNAGNATASPLKNIPQLAEGIGLGVSTPSAFTTGSRHYYATLGKRIYFVGRRAAGALGATPTGVSVFSFDGSRFEKVSTPAVDKILQGLGVYHISTVSVSGQTAIAFSMGIPASTTQRALMFFPEWNDWAEWTSIYAQFANDGTRFLGVNTSRKQSYFAATDTWQDNAVDFDSIIQFEIPNEKGSALKFMRMCGLDGTIERSASTLREIPSEDRLIYPAILTPEVAAEICRRSADGEGVLAIIADMKLPAETMDWLKEFHSAAIREAKVQQVRQKEKEQCATTQETSALQP
jgi:hypothetical protein